MLEENGEYHGKPRLVVSCDEDYSMSTNEFRMLQLTLENTTDEWVRITKVAVEFPTDGRGKKALIVSSEDVEDLERAISEKKRADTYNSEIALGTLAVGGDVVEAASNDVAVKSTAGGVSIAALTGLLVIALKDEHGKAQYSPVLPETHLLAGAFGVPPKLYIRRWIALDVHHLSNKSTSKPFFIELETDTGKRLRYKFETL